MVRSYLYWVDVTGCRIVETSAMNKTAPIPRVRISCKSCQHERSIKTPSYSILANKILIETHLSDKKNNLSFAFIIIKGTLFLCFTIYPCSGVHLPVFGPSPADRPPNVNQFNDLSSKNHCKITQELLKEGTVQSRVFSPAPSPSPPRGGGYDKKDKNFVPCGKTPR